MFDDTEEKDIETCETVSLLPDEQWDYYSGLPNPSWYEDLDDE
jgi:hypothetical protein